MVDQKSKQVKYILPNGQEVNASTLHRFREDVRWCTALNDIWCLQEFLPKLPLIDRRVFDMALEPSIERSGISYIEWVKICIVIAWYNMYSGIPKEARPKMDPQEVLERILLRGCRGTLLPKMHMPIPA